MVSGVIYFVAWKEKSCSSREAKPIALDFDEKGLLIFSVIDTITVTKPSLVSLPNTTYIYIQFHLVRWVEALNGAVASSWIHNWICAGYIPATAP